MQLKLEGVARYWQEGQSTALVQGVNLSLRAAKGTDWIQRVGEAL